MAMLATREAARRLELSAARGLAYQAERDREDLTRGLVDLVSALGWLKDSGADKDRLLEMAQLAHDAISLRDAACRKDMDEAGIYAEAIDLQELDDFIARIA